MAGTTTYYGVTYPTSTDYVKDGATAIQTVATGFDSAVAIPTYNAQTGTSYTFALTDVGKTVTASNASASTYTIPPTASVAWPTGTTLNVTNLGAGVVTFAAGAGVTVTNTAATLAQYASAALIRTGLNAWTVTPKSGSASGLTLITATTFTAASTINVNSCFSATYENYRVVISYSNLNSSTPTFRYRTGATDNSTGSYIGRFFGVADAATGATRNTSDTLLYLGDPSTYGASVMDILSPNKAQRTYMVQSQMTYASAASGSASNGSSMFNNTTVFDGFSVLGTANMTGTLRVYGYQD